MAPSASDSTASICAEYGSSYAFMAYITAYGALHYAAIRVRDETGNDSRSVKTRIAIRAVAEATTKKRQELIEQCNAFRDHTIRPGEEKIQESFADDCATILQAYGEFYALLDPFKGFRPIDQLYRRFLDLNYLWGDFLDHSRERMTKCSALVRDGESMMTPWEGVADAGATPCLQTLGAARVQELAAQCRWSMDGESSACDAENPCPTIFEELKRGCGRGVKKNTAPFCEPYAGRPCRETLGLARAQELVDRCAMVSPATHPPCNAANTCALIIGEIRRGCEYIGKENAPSYCNQF